MPATRCLLDLAGVTVDLSTGVPAWSGRVVIPAGSRTASINWIGAEGEADGALDLTSLETASALMDRIAEANLDALESRVRELLGDPCTADERWALDREAMRDAEVEREVDERRMGKAA